MGNLIEVGHVLSEINTAGSVFDVSFRKKDGTWSERKRCSARIPSNANGLENRKKMNRSGLVKLYEAGQNLCFDVYIDFLETFNGMTINHTA